MRRETGNWFVICFALPVCLAAGIGSCEFGRNLFLRRGYFSIIFVFNIITYLRNYFLLAFLSFFSLRFSFNVFEGAFFTLFWEFLPLAMSYSLFGFSFITQKTLDCTLATLSTLICSSCVRNAMTIWWLLQHQTSYVETYRPERISTSKLCSYVSFSRQVVWLGFEL